MFKKKIRIKQIILIVLVLLATSQAQIHQKVQFSEQDLKITKVIGQDSLEFVKLEYSNLDNNNIEGEPILPVKYLQLIIPTEMDVASIEYKNNISKIISIDKKLIPGEKNKPTNGMVVIDDYKSYTEEVYPKNIVSLINSGYLDGTNHIISVAVYPVQYNQIKNQISLSNEIDITINLRSSDKQARKVKVRSLEKQKEIDQLLYKMVDNKQDITNYQMKPDNLYKINENQIATGYYDYVVVTTTALKPSFNNFVNWKSRKGLKVLVKTIDEIVAEYPGGDLISGINDIAGSIRQYLADMYYENGLTYALLAGDKDDIPYRIGCGNWNTAHPFYSIPADIYFSDFNSDWNVDGDPFYGEVFGDYSDKNPEIFVGRLLFQSSEEVYNWTKKLIGYEQNPFGGEYSTISKYLWSESDELQDETLALSVISSSAKLSSLTNKIMSELPSYDSYPTIYPKGADVIREINKGYHFYNIYNHGGTYYTLVNCPGMHDLKVRPLYAYGIFSHDNDAPVDYQMETENGLDNIRNTSTIIYSIGCKNAAINETEEKRCLADVYTTLGNSGGVAFFGNTNDGWIDYSPILHQKFFNLLFLDNIYNAGKVESYSKILLNTCQHYISYTHNLIGDPEMPIWTEAPSTYNNVMITDNGSSVTVNAGIAGSKISVSSVNSDVYYHLSAENLTSYTFSTSIRPLYITITKQNYIPYSVVTGGNITTNTTLFGKIKIINNLTINSNATLSIDQGSDITLNNGVSLFVDGKLLANGTQQFPINIAGNTSEYGGTITFRNISITGNKISYTNFNKIAQIDLINSNNVTIENCNIINSMMYGVNVSGGANNSIINNKIENSNIYHAIVIQNGGNASVMNNIITKTSGKNGSGILFGSGSSGTFAKNDINGFDWGVGAIWGTSPTTNNSYTGSYKNNRITNCKTGIMVYNEGYPILGNPSEANTRRNSISGNLANVNIQQYPGYTSSLVAYGNWWGNYPPNTSLFTIGANGTFIYNNYLSYDPWSEIEKSVENNNEEAVQNKININSFAEGLKLRDDKKNNDAKDYFLSMLNNKGLNNKELKIYLYSCADKNNMDEITKYFENNIGNNEEDLKLLLSYLYVKQNNLEKAKENNSQIVNTSENEEIVMMASLSNFYIALYNESNITEATKLFDLINKVESKEIKIELQLAEDALNLAKNTVIAQKDNNQKSTTTNQVILPRIFQLHQNFPNPFNPSTTISFQIPNRMHVALKVYDVLGNLVKILVEETKEQGLYEVEFNASKLASGIYFYELRTNEKTSIKKMMMVK